MSTYFINTEKVDQQLDVLKSVKSLLRKVNSKINCVIYYVNLKMTII